ncbi:MAG: histidine--tRNA ligase [Alphaproteobacteria bacterium]|nr:MAG: histidine--tRNA ligase [Alphaproteobacteria bacterium]
MSKLQPVRGTRDLFGIEAWRHQAIIERFRALATRYRYQPIDPPIFEFTPVFARTLGDASDIVAKEMYSFEDRGGESITLRPEFTAGIARAYLSGGLQQFAPLKLYAYGPAFRYERPQKGRYRQFHQIDAEIIGAAEPQADAELIALAAALLEDLGLASKVTLLLNSLGDGASRAAYRQALVNYFSAHAAALSEDSRTRLARNPLRILDSKDEGDRRLIADAPLMADYMTPAARDFFATLCDRLHALGIGYVHDQRLVRGLDYYCHTAFEFVTDALGAQGTVLAGGRYDGLIEMMGGPSTPGVGWAAGIERLAMLAALPCDATRPVAVVPVSATADAAAMVLACDLRRAGLVVEHAFRGNVKKRLKRANEAKARFAVLIGEEELAAGSLTLKDLDSGEQQTLPRQRVIEQLLSEP